MDNYSTGSEARGRGWKCYGQGFCTVYRHDLKVAKVKENNVIIRSFCVIVKKYI